MKPHILVVDDSLTVRMDLRGALVAAGFDVTLSETKRAAEALLDQHVFSAVVLDVLLPDGDGIDILRRIRASTHQADLPVVMLSTEADVSDRVRGLTMGADEYVGKPYNIAYFIRQLRHLCSRSRSRNSTPPPVSIVGCRRILAVDDSPTFLAHLGRMLREDGHDVVLARSGREALDMLAAQTIDCVIIDLIMPDVDGIETIRRIRRIPGRESTPTLMLTGSENPEDQRNATAAGADEFVTKAVTLDVVRAKVRNLLRRKHREGQTSDAASVSTHANVFAERRVEGPATKDLSFQTSPSISLKDDKNREFSPLFLEVAATMGLDADRARDSLARTLGRINIDARAMNHTDLTRALPTLRDTLCMFFSVDEATPRAHALAMLASQSRHAIA
jgi:DNA-binding response OmpR family regulator